MEREARGIGSPSSERHILSSRLQRFAGCLLVGMVVLAVSNRAFAQANDDFASATVVSNLPFTDSQTTPSATDEANEPSSCGDSSALWYSFTPASDTFVTADTFGSDFDTVLAVYTGTDLASLSDVTCDDDACNLQSQVAFNASSGTTYYFQVGGLFGSTGDVVFNINVDTCGDGTCNPSACEDSFSCYADCSCGDGFCDASNGEDINPCYTDCICG